MKNILFKVTIFISALSSLLSRFSQEHRPPAPKGVRNVNILIYFVYNEIIDYINISVCVWFTVIFKPEYTFSHFNIVLERTMVCVQN